jgi:hypothetical protein
MTMMRVQTFFVWLTDLILAEIGLRYEFTEVYLKLSFEALSDFHLAQLLINLMVAY